jgi:hypothetical protein
MTNKIDLSGRFAVVTGGAQGIGRAIVERFLDSGAAVAIWDRDRKLADATAGELKARNRVAAVAVDVTRLAEVERGRTARRPEPAGSRCSPCRGGWRTAVATRGACSSAAWSWSIGSPRTIRSRPLRRHGKDRRSICCSPTPQRRSVRCKVWSPLRRLSPGALSPGFALLTAASA